MRLVLRGWGAAVAAVLVLLVSAAPAHAGTFYVTNTTDPGSPSPGDGSLREAINQANASSDSTNTISISATGTINLQGALPVISKPMQIEGPGSASLAVHRQSGGSYGIFAISGLVTVAISGVTVSNGSVAGYGGGIAINGSTVTLTDVTVSNNAAGTGGAGIVNGGGTLTLSGSMVTGNTVNVAGCCGGGGIYNQGTLTLTNTTISHNSTTGSFGGGIVSFGNASTVTLLNSTVSDNTASTAGGGIYNGGAGTLSLTDSAVSGNTASDVGGGIYNDGTLSLTDGAVIGNTATRGGGIRNHATFTLTGSTVSGNTASDHAGGILTGGPGGAMTIDSSTVSGNHSNGGSGGGGGGIQNDGTADEADPPTLTIVNSTIANNTAANNGGGVDTFNLDSNPSQSQMPTTTVASSTVAANAAGGAGGGLNEFQGNYVVRNSIIARNAAGSNPDCSNVQPNSPSFGSEGYNLVGDTTGCTGFTGVGDLVNKNPLLAGSGSALTNNGGPTQTIALLAGSPALHNGNPAAPGSGDPACPAADQRGLPRGGAAARCDIGAVQPGPPTITINTPANSATLGQGQTVASSYSCTADPSTTISSCKGPAANGSSIDTSTLGPHTFTVNAADALGASSSLTSDYSVATTPLKPTITDAKINSGKRKARFKFTDSGTLTGYQCALIKRGKKRSQPHFVSCRSPKTYKHLKPGRYTFEVRALIGTLAGPAATGKFTI
jgi:hypothetical protein